MTLERSYAYTKTLGSTDVATVAERVRAALAEEGFGVMTEIDVQKAMREKLGVERKPYVILGACNPQLAHQALAHEPPIGVLLPCNVTVFEHDDGSVVVQAIDPRTMFSVIGRDELRPIADEVATRLQRVLEKI
ncbi:MAG: DUF302 domain-containing protein [Acidobacteria bacterium]|nr:MAG: DUF302 domain-containing protein [Acidobacteriota bacterium]